MKLPLPRKGVICRNPELFVATVTLILQRFSHAALQRPEKDRAKEAWHLQLQELDQQIAEAVTELANPCYAFELKPEQVKRVDAFMGRGHATILLDQQLHGEVQEIELAMRLSDY